MLRARGGSGPRPRKIIEDALVRNEGRRRYGVNAAAFFGASIFCGGMLWGAYWRHMYQALLFSTIAPPGAGTQKLRGAFRFGRRTRGACLFIVSGEIHRGRVPEHLAENTFRREAEPRPRRTGSPAPRRRRRSSRCSARRSRTTCWSRRRRRCLSGNARRARGRAEIVS